MDRAATEAAGINSAYYERHTDGREDYWRKMAAARHRVDVLLAAVKQVRPTSIVDLGCGNGVLLEEIRSRNPDVRLAGVDLSKEQIEKNRQASPWCGWHVADLDGPVSFPPELRDSFDAVVATEVIEHVDNPADLLKNAYALCRSGGHLLLSTQSGPVRETERSVGHRRHFSSADMTELLQANGWVPERVWNTGYPFHDLSKWIANLDPKAAMTRFGEKPYGWKEDLVCRGLRLAFRLNSTQRGAQLFAIARRP